MALCVFAAALAFTLPSAPTRREMLVASSGLAVTSFTVVPQAAALGKQLPPKGVALLREIFDGELPPGGLMEWYEEHLASNFVATFAGGAVTLDKAAYLAVTADLLKSFPDFTYTGAGFNYQDSPRKVAWTATVRGTHTGAPYSPLPGLPQIASKDPPTACQNDPERVEVYFASGCKQIETLRVTAVPGGKGYSGPIGFYLQVGGDPSKLPKA